MSGLINARLRLIGYMSYCAESDNFMLPIFGDDMLPNLFAIQYVDELSSVVSGFKKVELDQKDFRSTSLKVYAGVGDDPIYVFLDDQRNISAGKLADLKAVFSQYETKNPNNSGTILQIKELIGDQDAKRAARKKVRNLMFDHSSETVAKNFLEGSVLKTELWNILLKYSPSRDAALNILNARPKLLANIDESNRVSIDLSALSPDDYGNLSIENIIRDLQREIDGTVRPDRQVEDEVFVELSFSIEDIDRHVSRARSLGRQEERVAVILSYLLSDYDLGKEVVKSYKGDRSGFANEAMRLISSTMIHNRPKNYSNDALVEMLIAQLYKRCFPMNRGALLYYFAKHLGEYENLNASLRDLWESSGAVFVHQWDNEISEQLDCLGGAKSIKRNDLFGNQV